MTLLNKVTELSLKPLLPFLRVKTLSKVTSTGTVHYLITNNMVWNII